MTSASQVVREPLGTTGMTITRVGFGAWAVGGPGWSFGWSVQDDSESIAAIRRAIEGGVNWIDTAAVYGLGHSERVVERALSGFAPADRPYVSTKGGLVWDENQRSLRLVRSATPPAFAVKSRIRCAASASIASTCIRCIGRPRMGRLSRSTGHAARPEAGGQDPRSRLVEPFSRAARDRRTPRPRRFAAAAILGHQA